MAHSTDYWMCQTNPPHKVPESKAAHWWFSVAGYVAAVLCAAGVYKVLMAFHAPHIKILIGITDRIIQGKPDWLAQQNRLLGPYLVLLISKLNVSFSIAWMIFTGLWLAIESVLLFYVLRKQDQTPIESIKFVVIFWFFFLTLQDFWLYTWDGIDLIIFTLFAYGIIKEKSTAFHLALFSVAIFNRESALFIATYILVSAFKFTVRPPSLKLVGWSKLLLGGLLLVGGTAYTQYVRHVYFVSTGDGRPDVEHQLLGNHVRLLENLRSIFVDCFGSEAFPIFIIVVLAIAFFLSRIRSFQDGELKCLLISLVILLNTMVFGLFNETRMFFILLPFALFLSIGAMRRDLPGSS
jgi:hypothetical protein